MKTFTVATIQYNCSEPDQKLNTEWIKVRKKSQRPWSRYCIIS